MQEGCFSLTDFDLNGCTRRDDACSFSHNENEENIKGTM
jgi:hypothetical protein